MLLSQILFAQTPAPQGAQVAAGQISVRLAAPAEGHSYRLEVDGVDVSACVEQIADGAAIELRFRPLSPLAPGAHMVRLYQSDGARLEAAGDWELSVPPPGSAYSAALKAYASGHDRSAASDKVKNQPVPRSTGDGTLSPAFSWQSGSLQTAGNADLLWNTQALSPQEKLELGNFLLRAGAGPAWVQAGHQSLLPMRSSYIVDNSQRRGVALHAGGSRYSIDGFAASSDPLQGFRRGFGIGDPARRIVGGFAGVTPVQGAAGALRLWAGSQRTRTSMADSIGTADVDNRASSIALEGNLGALSLQSEFAHSETELGSGAPYEGDALGGTLSFTPLPVPWGEHLVGWSGMVEHHRVDSRFDSRASFGVPVDQQRSTANFSFSIDRFTMQGQWSRAHDNVDGLPVGRVGATLAGLYLSLTPSAGAPGWYGAPTWMASATSQRNEQQQPHPDPGVPAVDDSVRDVLVGLRLDHGTWSWGLSQHALRTVNRGVLVFERETDDTALDFASAGFGLGQKARLAPRLSLIRSEERVSSVATNYVQTGLNFILQPGYSLNFVFDASYARNLSDDRAVDDYQWLLAPLLSWQKPLPGGTALELSLGGNYQHADSALFAQENWQVLLGLGLTLPLETAHAD